MTNSERMIIPSENSLNIQPRSCNVYNAIFLFNNSWSRRTKPKREIEEIDSCQLQSFSTGGCNELEHQRKTHVQTYLIPSKMDTEAAL